MKKKFINIDFRGYFIKGRFLKTAGIEKFI